MIITYSLSNDFSAGVNLQSLSQELTSVFHPVKSMGSDGDTDLLTIEYTNTKTSAELTTIDGVIAAHTGAKASTDVIHETIMLVPVDTEVKNANDWQDFGGVIVAPSSFPVEIQNIKGQITGQYRLGMGMNAEICLLETGPWNALPDADLIDPPHVLPATGGIWLPFTAFTNITVRNGYWSYVLKARKGSCSEFYLRYLTLAIVEERY